MCDRNCSSEPPLLLLLLLQHLFPLDITEALVSREPRQGDPRVPPPQTFTLGRFACNLNPSDLQRPLFNERDYLRLSSSDQALAQKETNLAVSLFNSSLAEQSRHQNSAHWADSTVVDTCYGWGVD